MHAYVIKRAHYCVHVGMWADVRSNVQEWLRIGVDPGGFACWCACLLVCSCAGEFLCMCFRVSVYICAFWFCLIRNGRVHIIMRQDSISSFTHVDVIETMKRYFTHVEPILIGSKVTFLTPDKSPIQSKKKILCRNYSYASKLVTRGTVVAVNYRKQQLQVRHYKPGVEKAVVTKVPMTQAYNSANVYVNRKLLMSAMQYKKHLSVGVPPMELSLIHI